jgi:hypothetical protein
MINHDDRAPSPTDPPVDETPTHDDTEGHLFNPELDRTLSREHAREADRIARDSARAREAHKDNDGGFFKRLTRR